MKLKSPDSFEMDFVVEVMHDNNPQTTSSFHYETFEKARNHFEKIKENENAFITLSIEYRVHRGKVEDFRRWILAKNK